MSKSVPLHKVPKAAEDVPDWRELADALLPELYAAASEWEEPTTYSFFTDLLVATREAHRVNNKDLLRRAYAFANWAFDHPSKELWNPAGVSFFEDLFKGAKDVDHIVSWIRPDIYVETIQLVEYMFGAKVAEKINTVKKNCKVNFTSETVLAFHEATRKLRVH